MVRPASRLIAVAALAAAACTNDPGPASTSEPTRPPPPSPSAVASRPLRIERFAVPSGSHPHDVAPAAHGGGVWYTAQHTGELGLLDPSDGSVEEIALGSGSRPHGVIVGPDGNAWVTDGGLDAIVRVDADTHEVTSFPLPTGRRGANLNTAAFAPDGVQWFTGQSGIYGKVDDGRVTVYDAPGGRGPYGITATPEGDVYYASLAGSHIARIDTATGRATRIDPPTAGQGARRVWADSGGRIWVSEWNAGQVGVYEPSARRWEEWTLPGERPQAYAVYVDEADDVWLTDFGGNAIVRFDPDTERFTSVDLPDPDASVRQLLGRPGEIWGAASSSDALYLIRTR